MSYIIEVIIELEPYSVLSDNLLTRKTCTNGISLNSQLRTFPTGFCIACILSFNVGTAGAKIFSSGPGVQEFGYTVQQLSNNQGKW